MDVTWFARPAEPFQPQETAATGTASPAPNTKLSPPLDVSESAKTEPQITTDKCFLSIFQSLVKIYNNISKAKSNTDEKKAIPSLKVLRLHTQH